MIERSIIFICGRPVLQSARLARLSAVVEQEGAKIKKISGGATDSKHLKKWRR